MMVMMQQSIANMEQNMVEMEKKMTGMEKMTEMVMMHQVEQGRQLQLQNEQQQELLQFGAQQLNRGSCSSNCSISWAMSRCSSGSRSSNSRRQSSSSSSLQTHVIRSGRCVGRQQGKSRTSDEMQLQQRQRRAATVATGTSTTASGRATQSRSRPSKYVSK